MQRIKGWETKEMLKYTFKLSFLLLLAFSYSKTVWAENDQNLVIDMGFGVHFFNEADEYRDANTFINNISALGQIGIEWYVLDNVGFGFRQLNIFGKSTDNELGKEYTIRNSFFTVNLVPFGGTRYARVIMVYGIGTGRYSANEYWEDDEDSTKNYDYSGFVDGTVSIGQIYGDWGGEDFGFRAGISYLLTEFDTLELGPKSYEVNSSGFSFCSFSIRYAF